ncbi:hypothetical protein [Aneurinibacillus terranovensis]|uniref:hypothetical protein n=1 Tax=Aneurinibacillus terranovensis TaxID=278991 RepID=UPI00041BC0F6|nr:hypothetical protein [Aneurinibacillus terranovensis]
MQYGKRFILLIVLALFASLNGCSPNKNTITYNGQGDSWKGILTITKNKAAKQGTGKLTLIYYKTDSDPVKHVSYELRGLGDDVKGYVPLLSENGTLAQDFTCTKCMDMKNDAVQVKVKWNFGREAFVLPLVKQ